MLYIFFFKKKEQFILHYHTSKTLIQLCVHYTYYAINMTYIIGSFE